MSFIYKGIHYKEIINEADDRFGKTGYFNEEFKSKIQNTGKAFAMVVYKAVKKNLLQPNKIYNFVQLANQVGEKYTSPDFNIKFEQTNKETNYYYFTIENGKPTITCSIDILNKKDVDEYHYRMLLHEIVHMFQYLETGEYGGNEYNNDTGDSTLAYYSNKYELNAHLHEIINFIESVPGKLKSFQGLNFGDFLNKIMHDVLRWNNYEEYISENFDEDTSRKFYEILYLYWKKINKIVDANK